jgi:hypothetical protein
MFAVTAVRFDGETFREDLPGILKLPVNSSLSGFLGSSKAPKLEFTGKGWTQFSEKSVRTANNRFFESLSFLGISLIQPKMLQSFNEFKKLDEFWAWALELLKARSGFQLEFFAYFINSFVCLVLLKRLKVFQVFFLFG